MLATAVYLLKGIPFIYQGQEYGAANSYFENLQDFNDVETLRYYKDRESDPNILEKINRGSRDNPRRPMAWNGQKYYGFSTAKPWLACPSRGKEIHLEKDKQSEKSVFRFYQALLALRKKLPALRYGKFADQTQGKGYFSYTRSYRKQTVLVVCNFQKQRKIPLIRERKKLLLSNYAKRYNDPKNNLFQPFEIAVYSI